MSVKQSYSDTFSKPTLYPTQKPCMNDRYRPAFRQNYFTAGDEEQFMEYSVGSAMTAADISSLTLEWNITVSDKFKNAAKSARADTFRYIFYKFKKGIYVQIREGKVAVFLPFSNAYFVNEWSELIQKPLPSELCAPNVLPLHFWYANNYLVRYESPINEADTGHAAIKNMFDELCATRRVSDVEFFVNRRDFPLLKQDGTEAYEAIFGPDRPLLSHQYKSYLPILSMVEGDKFADLAIPTPDDWSRVMSTETPPKYFMSTKRTLETFKDDFCKNWNMKYQKAVFRGSATGIGVGTLNHRIQLAEMTARDSRLDAGIVGNSQRYQIQPDGSLVKQTPRANAQYMSPKEQSKYKYIIHVSGHVRGFRLSTEFAYQSVILLVGDMYRLWFERRLEPWKHYVPVNEDLSDLGERLDWCEANDAECEQIAKRAREFYENYLNKEGILSYLHELVMELSRHRTPHCAAKVPEYIHVPTRVNLPVVSQSRCFFGITSRATQAKKLSKHEAIVGLTCVNSILRSIPNFSYTHSSTSMERLNSKTMKEYIKGRDFIFKDWLCMLKQLALAFKVAQRKCRFVHHSAITDNIVIYENELSSHIDYLVGRDLIIRASTRRVPILINYAKSYGEGKFGVIQSFGGFEPFKDCISVLVSSARDVVKYQRLSGAQQTILVDLFNRVLRGNDVYFRGGCFRELKGFLDVAAAEPHLSFFPKGKLVGKDPMELYNAIDYGDFASVDLLEFTHLGTVMDIVRRPEGPGLFQRYALQQLWRVAVNKHRFPPAGPEVHAREYFISNLSLGGDMEGLVKRRAGCCEIIFMLEEMLADGGRYMLTAAEREGVLELIDDLSST